MKKYRSRQDLAKHVGTLISNDRNKTHGDPHVQFACAQELKAVIIKYAELAGRDPLPPSEAEARDMILTKISRATCGANLQDHWLDIAGYSIIAAEKAEG